MDILYDFFNGFVKNLSISLGNGTVVFSRKVCYPSSTFQLLTLAV